MKTQQIQQVRKKIKKKEKFNSMSNVHGGCEKIGVVLCCSFGTFRFRFQVFLYDIMNIFRSPLFLWSIPILKFIMFTSVSQGTIKERRYTERI